MFEIKLQQTLDLDLTLDSGQCFRWNKIGDWWYGVVDGNVWKCRVDGCNLIVEVIKDALSKPVSKKEIIHYFNLDRNYSAILDSIRKDSHMEKLLEYFHGMTILNQDPYETFLSYILTANNNVPRVKTMIKVLSQNYGRKISVDKIDFHTFPILSELQNVSEDDYKNLKFGFRSKYLKSTIDSLLNINEKTFWEDSIKDKSLLTDFYGVGEKIADCTRIYSLGRDEVVPVDVWIRRILTKLYKLPDKMKYQDFQKFAIDYFGKYAGWAQMFLFVGGRTGKI